MSDWDIGRWMNLWAICACRLRVGLKKFQIENFKFRIEGKGPPGTTYFESLEGTSTGARTWAIVSPGGNFSFTSNLRYSIEPG